ncbi:MAG TPA: hypothetical protein VNQ77_02905 [Frankiaceae bacterium]|nr:hypothetical protein [Frankiaceae bacterium]
MRRDLLGLRSFVILVCAMVAGTYLWLVAGAEPGITGGLVTALTLHTLVGK